MTRRRQTELVADERIMRDLVDEAKSVSLGQSRFLPPFHYQIGENNHLAIIDDIGSQLVEIGYKVSERYGSEHGRFYIARDRVRSLEGAPINIVHLRHNELPEYTLVRKDGFNNQKTLRGGSVVTGEFNVEGLSGNLPPTMLMMLAGSRTPIYHQTRELLYEATEKYPLFDDDEYQEFMKSYKEIDHWLVRKDS